VRLRLVDPESHPLWENAPEMPRADCMTIDEARAALGLRWSGSVVSRCADYIDPCRMDGGEPGVTRASIDRELRWWRDATLTSKVRRRVRDTFQWL
jgi:hypothetical protein